MKDVLAPEQLDRVIEHAMGNVHNFFDHQLEDGYIPMMIEVADWQECRVSLHSDLCTPKFSFV